MSQITGRCWLYIDGALVRSKAGAKLQIGGIERKTVKGAQVWGYAEGVTEPQVEATLADTADLSLTAINAITDATVTFETDTGKQYVLRHAWVANSQTLSEGEGDVAVTINAMSCEEMLG